jgi:hypothetical protein
MAIGFVRRVQRNGNVDDSIRGYVPSSATMTSDCWFDPRQAGEARSVQRARGGHTRFRAMGRPSEAERIKLHATYLNGVAVGLTLTGCLVPILAIVPRGGYLVERVTSGVPLSFVEVTSVVGTVLAMAMALTGGRRMHRAADATLRRLDDHTDDGRAH